ncbi:MAG: alanine:cation symporter family protein, partial [Fusobacteriaceae bacterium]
MEVFISKLMNWIWTPLIYLCLGTGIYFSLITRFPQVRGINQFKKLLFAKNDGEGISSFQAFSIAISGRVGTGNIAGVATAIYFGGPGSIFWMWAIAFLGAASAFVESALGQVWKERDGEIFRGGPAYYIEKGMKCKWYANLFAIVTVLSVGILLPGVQGN